MKAVFRTFCGVAAALVLAFVLVIAVELFSAVVHPFPPGFEHSMEEMCRHVARYPDWVLAVVVLMWGGTAFIGTWIATRIGNRAAGIFVAVVLSAAIVFNVSMLPYALWFKVVMPAAAVVACWLGCTRGRRGPLLAVEVKP